MVFAEIDVADMVAVETTKLPNVPVLAVTVLAERLPLISAPEATIDVAVIEALATTRFVKVPVFFVMEVDVIPFNSLCVCPDEANPESAVPSPLTSAIECVCPSSATAFPWTVRLVASITLKFSWSKVAAP